MRKEKCIFPVVLLKLAPLPQTPGLKHTKQIARSNFYVEHVKGPLEGVNHSILDACKTQLKNSSFMIFALIVAYRKRYTDSLVKSAQHNEDILVK